MQCKVSYISIPLITTGEGAREWQEGDFWQTSLPVIYLKIFPEIFKIYKESGLAMKNYKLIVKNFSFKTGHLYARYHLRRIFRKEVKDCNSIDVFPKNIYFYINVRFYLGYFRGFVKAVFQKLG
jgi:hypothetical protein